eukprot:TRINITY_DN7777_c0_g1_i1.p1 TRINITY_DN7777_c0_g1~~TRINITY_DN7777_c0_g1_i1.p1  ORF type:complete len:115 (-),score=28.59 TRINITY_DN7777_c0_g1_i1:265-609(-)
MEDEEPKEDSHSRRDDAKDGSFLEAEPLASGGLAEALKLVRRKGLIDDDVTTDFAGRANDERHGWIHEFKTYYPDIHLVYPDEFGRPMTRKEAFRKLSHRFHGKVPEKQNRRNE